MLFFFHIVLRPSLKYFFGKLSSKNYSQKQFWVMLIVEHGKKDFSKRKVNCLEKKVKIKNTFCLSPFRNFCFPNIFVVKTQW
jgi:hypothetical protein